jgi:hypothetical protein
MERAVAVEVGMDVALVCCCIWHLDCHLGRPRHGGVRDNGHESWPSPRRIVADVIVFTPLGVTAERGEDPTVNGSHDREEEGGAKDNNDNK